MKTRFLSLLFITGYVHAESYQLPPVVDNSTYPAAPAASSTPSTSTKTMYEMMGRLEQMQVEIQQLTGKVEEQTFQINELKKRQNTMYSDFDERLQGFENKGGSAEKTDAEAPAAEAKPSVSAPPPTPPTPTPQPKPSVVAPAVASVPKPAEPQKKPEPVQVATDEKQVYQNAYDALRNGHTSQSISEFDAFLKKYPASPLANNAQYWLGEAHRVNQDADSARTAFKKVVDNYAGGSKVPDALLKLGYIELEQKNQDKGREYLTRVTNEYPGTAAAHLASKKLLSIDGATP